MASNISQSHIPNAPKLWKFLRSILDFLRWLFGSRRIVLGVMNTEKGIALYTTDGVGKRMFRITAPTIDTLSRRGEELCTFRTIHGSPEEIHFCSGFRFFMRESIFVATYQRKNQDGIVLSHSTDGLVWQEVNSFEHISGPLVACDSQLPRQGFVGVGTHGENLSVLRSVRKKTWKVLDQDVLTPRVHAFDSEVLIPIDCEATTDGILVLYDASEQTESGTEVSIGAALLASSDPTHVLWRSDVALYEYEMKESSKLSPVGAVYDKHDVHIFYTSSRGKLFYASIHYPFSRVRDEQIVPFVEKFYDNPIVEPHDGHEWEQYATYNAAAVEIDGKIHLLYRAQGPDGVSRLGYAASDDGLTFTKRHSHPAYVPRADFEGAIHHNVSQSYLFSSPWGCGGCEDPRLTHIDERVYLTYVAFNGSWPTRTAISSIDINDFLTGRWQKWSRPALLSPAGIDSKSACILPEKVNGKYIIFHRTWPDVVIDEVDDLDFSSDDKWLNPTPSIPPWRNAEGKYAIVHGTWPHFETEWTEHEHDHDVITSERWQELVKERKRIMSRPDEWDSHKISFGAPPVKTKYGWLAIYSAVDRRDMSRYKIGAMLLDSEDPSHVLYRSKRPIIIPDEWYENDGKPGVVYPSGLVIKDDQLFIYYGGADRVTCVATAELDEFVRELMNEEVMMPPLTRVMFV